MSQGVSCGLGYEHMDYQPTISSLTAGRVDDYVQAKIGFDVRFTRNWTGHASYIYRTLSSTAWEGFKNNQTNIGLQWTS
jgi:hypothetical protein